MAKHISITLIKALIVNTVKNVTFHNGQIDKSADEKNIVPAYHESAGNETYHERLLERGYYTNVELLKTHLSDYLDGTGNLADDPLISDEEADGTNTLILKVSDRFNDGYTKTLARLCSRFVEDNMIADWYATFDEKRSAYFSAIAQKDLTAILSSFNKTAPIVPTYNFPTAIELRYPVIPERNGIPGTFSSPVASGSPAGSTTPIPVETLFANPYVIACGQESEISYTLSGEDDRRPIDDIIVRCDNGCCEPFISSNGHWNLRAKSMGYTIVTLFSRHNDQVYNRFAVRVV